MRKHGLDGSPETGIDQFHRAAGPLVVSAGVPQPVDHGVEDLAGAGRPVGLARSESFICPSKTPAASDQFT